MDRRQFISTVGAATAVAAASTALSEDAAHAEPLAGPRELPPDQVDNRFLDTLTTVNNLQIPATLASYQQQIDTLASPRALAQSALRLVSAYVNPRGQNYHSEALLGPLNTLLDALADRQNPSGLYDIGNLDSPPDTSFVISDLGIGYDLLGRTPSPRPRRRGRRTRRSCGGRPGRWPRAGCTPRTIAGRSARRWPISTTCGRAGCCWPGSTTGWVNGSTRMPTARTANAARSTPRRSPTAPW